MSPARVIREVVGVQAQDLAAALLSVRVRSEGLTAAGVEQARQEERSIVRTWCLRGTLHLVAAEDARWLVPFLGSMFAAGDQRRMRQLGWDEGRTRTGLKLLHEALVEQGSLTRPEIIRLLQANSLPYEGQAPVHLLFRAAMEGMLCSGADRGKETSYALFDSWIGEAQPLPHPEALARIARRYLEANGPAGPEDLASWSGLRLSEAREAWQLIADQLLPVEVEGRSSWLLKTHFPWLDEPIASAPLVRLLPRFDTYLLGYADRHLAVDPSYAGRINAGGGLISAVLLVNGRALGTWKLQRRSKHVEIVLEPFESVSAELLPLINAEVADIGRFIGEEAVLNIARDD